MNFPPFHQPGVVESTGFPTTGQSLNLLTIGGRGSGDVTRTLSLPSQFTIAYILIIPPEFPPPLHPLHL